MASAKLAPDSLLTVEDQAAEYRRAMGDAAAERQERAAKLKAGRCVCEPSKVRKRWQGETTATVRTVHAPDCPKHLPWMHD